MQNQNNSTDLTVAISDECMGSKEYHVPQRDVALNSVFYLDYNIVLVEAFKRGLRQRKMGSFFFNSLLWINQAGLQCYIFYLISLI